MRREYKYCDSCKIIFKVGCYHCVLGCTDSIYNAHFIQQWKNKIDNEIFDGMPKFDDIDDWFNNVNYVEVLKLYCPHKSYKCQKNRI